MQGAIAEHAIFNGLVEIKFDILTQVYFVSCLELVQSKQCVFDTSGTAHGGGGSFKIGGP